MTSRAAGTATHNVRILDSCLSIQMEPGTFASGYGLTVNVDNSTNGVTCESLLDDLHATQAKDNVILSPTEKALIVILERIVEAGSEEGRPRSCVETPDDGRGAESYERV